VNGVWKGSSFPVRQRFRDGQCSLTWKGLPHGTGQERQHHLLPLRLHKTATVNLSPGAKLNAAILWHLRRAISRQLLHPEQPTDLLIAMTPTALLPVEAAVSE
jgi:hypothetical protein